MTGNRQLQFNEAIREALDQSLEADQDVILMGLGITDPKGVFGTTSGLLEKYGRRRIFETPTAENGTMGIAIGASLVGAKPVVTHQRVEFALLAVEQIANQAAKWNYMTGGRKSVPVVIRLIVGRGWGQGPQHSQSLESWFAHIPGLKVVAPSSSKDAKGMLTAAIRDPNPVIFIEHRWLHHTFGEVPIGTYEVEIGKARIAKQGKDLTIVAYSYMVVEALKAAEAMADEGIDVEVVDLRSFRPLDLDTIIRSISKTKRLLTIDCGWANYGIGSEIITSVVTTDFKMLIAAPQRLGIADVPIPSTRALANLAYPGPIDIVEAVEKILSCDLTNIKSSLPEIGDTPNKAFTGPF